MRILIQGTTVLIDFLYFLNSPGYILQVLVDCSETDGKPPAWFQTAVDQLMTEWRGVMSQDDPKKCPEGPYGEIRVLAGAKYSVLQTMRSVARAA
jgi:hypothetical protein